MLGGSRAPSAHLFGPASAGSAARTEWGGLSWGPRSSSLLTQITCRRILVLSAKGPALITHPTASRTVLPLTSTLLHKHLRTCN